MTLQDSSQAPQREHCDLLVIGAGQGGGPLAGAFARAGRRVVLVERAHVGGTCINEGCSPTKTIIASARVAHLVRLAREYGVLVGDTPGDSGLVDLTKVRARKQVQVLYLILDRGEDDEQLLQSSVRHAGR